MMKMISSKQKDVLKGFLKQANAHNKFLEEQLLWKKRYEEFNPNSQSIVSRSNEMETYNEKNDFRGVKFYDVVKDKNGNEVIDEKDKWTHDGFQMLYPNGSTADSGKWKHDLYETINKPKSKYNRSKHSKNRSRSSNSSESECSSDTERPKGKRQRKRMKHRSLSKEKHRRSSRESSYSYSRESSSSTGKQIYSKKRRYHREISNSSKSSSRYTRSSNSRSNSRHSSSRSDSRSNSRSDSRSNSSSNSSSNIYSRRSNRSSSSNTKKSDKKSSSRSLSRSSIRIEARLKSKNVKISNGYQSSSPSNDAVSDSPYQKPHTNQLKETLNANLEDGKQKKYKIKILLKKKENVPDENQNSAKHESKSSVSERTKSLRNSVLKDKPASSSSSSTINKRNAIKIRSKQRSRYSSSSSSESFSSSDQHGRSDNKRKKLIQKNQSSSSDSLLRAKFKKLSKRKKIKELERLLAKERRRR